MEAKVPLSSYAELLKQRLNAVRTLVRSLRESQTALLNKDVAQSAEFTEQQLDLCNEIVYLDRDLRNADEILAWAEMLGPATKEIEDLRGHMRSAETELAAGSAVHSALVRRARRSVTVMINAATAQKNTYYSPSSFQALQANEEV